MAACGPLVTFFTLIPQQLKVCLLFLAMLKDFTSLVFVNLAVNEETAFQLLQSLEPTTSKAVGDWKTKPSLLDAKETLATFIKTGNLYQTIAGNL